MYVCVLSVQYQLNTHNHTHKGIKGGEGAGGEVTGHRERESACTKVLCEDELLLSSLSLPSGR